MPCMLTIELAWSFHPLCTDRENVNNGAHQFLCFWVVPLVPGELSWLVPQHSLCGLSLSLLCAEAVQLAYSCLSGGNALNIGVHLLFS